MNVSLQTYDPNTQLLRLRGGEVVPEARKWWKNGWLARKVTGLFSDRYKLSRISEVLYGMGPAEAGTAEGVLAKIRERLERHFPVDSAKLARLKQRLLPPGMYALGGVNPNAVLDVNMIPNEICQLEPQVYEDCIKLCESLTLRGFRTREASFTIEDKSFWFDHHATLKILVLKRGSGGAKAESSQRELGIKLFTDTIEAEIRDNGVAGCRDVRTVRGLVALATEALKRAST